MTQFKYPTIDKIIEFNYLVLDWINVKRADSHKILSKRKLSNAINKCKKAEGDLYTRAAILMKSLIKAHAFASGNRRTAFITTKYFVKQNNGKFNIKDDPKYARVMTGIKEGYYSLDEIKEWIKNGKIRKFER